MGFEFKSEEGRNPTQQPLSHEQLQAEKQLENPCTALQAQLDEINEFIDENRLLQKFYAWQELKLQLRDTSAEVIDDAKIIE
jgi:hypothetical protein